MSHRPGLRGHLALYPSAGDPGCRKDQVAPSLQDAGPKGTEYQRFYKRKEVVLHRNTGSRQEGHWVEP